MIQELLLRGVAAKSQVSFPVCYKGHYGGEYMADLVVAKKVIVELKCVDRFSEIYGLARQAEEVHTAGKMDRDTGADRSVA
jgi:GxxExxY protein